MNGPNEEVFWYRLAQLFETEFDFRRAKIHLQELTLLSFRVHTSLVPEKVYKDRKKDSICLQKF